jgi:hypothetical protein
MPNEAAEQYFQKALEREKKRKEDLKDLKGSLSAAFKELVLLYPIKAASLLFGVEFFHVNDALGIGNIGFWKAFGAVWAFRALTSVSQIEPPRAVRVVKNKWRGDQD